MAKVDNGFILTKEWSSENGNFLNYKPTSLDWSNGFTKQAHFQLDADKLQELCDSTVEAMGCNTRVEMFKYSQDVICFEDHFFDTENNFLRLQNLWLKERTSTTTSDEEPKWILNRVFRDKENVMIEVDVRDNGQIASLFDEVFKMKKEKETMRTYIERIGLKCYATMKTTRYQFPKIQDRPDIQVDVATWDLNKYRVCCSMESPKEEHLKSLNASGPIRSKIIQLLHERSDEELECNNSQNGYKDPILFDHDPLQQFYVEPSQCYTKSESERIAQESAELIRARNLPSRRSPRCRQNMHPKYP